MAILFRLARYLSKFDNYWGPNSVGKVEVHVEPLALWYDGGQLLIPSPSQEVSSLPTPSPRPPYGRLLRRERRSQFQAFELSSKVGLHLHNSMNDDISCTNKWNCGINIHKEKYFNEHGINTFINIVTFNKQGLLEVKSPITMNKENFLLCIILKIKKNR